jgi:hypothetical protein
MSLALPFAVLSLGGCSAGAHSPTIDVLGSYFPAWMVCMVAGVILTVLVRLLLVGLLLERHVWLKPLVYASMVAFFAALVWLMFFRN